MRNFLWIVEANYGEGWEPASSHSTRKEAREYVKYFNGFSHGTRNATRRVRKYMRAEK